MANTNFRSSGTDLANLSAFSNLLSKEYVFDRYPDVIPFFRKAGLWSWGSNSSGQLGDNTSTDGSSPIQYKGDAIEWKTVSAGSSISGGIKTDGTLWMWGNNYNGSLGNNENNYTGKSSPVQTVSAGTNWKQVACGGGHTGAIKTDGTLWMWGENWDGELGDNTGGYGTFKSSPVQTVSGGSNWESVSCGEGHTGAIKTDGTLWMWGRNYDGELGDDTQTIRSSPVQTVAGGSNWKQVSCGQYITGAIKTDGTLWMWGMHFSGQLGDNTTAGYGYGKSSPVQTVAGGSNWKFVSCGLGQSSSSSGHVSALKTDGTLWLWGANLYGELGDNTSGFGGPAAKSSPVQTSSAGTNWKKVSSGGSFTAAVKSDGTIWMWGNYNNGRLGIDTFSNKSNPTQIQSQSIGWKEVSIGLSHTLAIRDNSEDPL